MEEMRKTHMNGFITTISLMRPALPIKRSAMTMVLDAQPKLNAKIVFQAKDAGLKKELKSMVFINMERSKEKKT